MLTTTQGKEIVIKMPNRIGALAEVARLVSEHGIGIRAACAWVEGETAMVRLVTDDNLRASDALRAKKFDLTERPVVLVEVPHKPGMLKFVTETLHGASIDLHHLYATSLPKQDHCLLVLAGSDNQRAVVALNEVRGK